MTLRKLANNVTELHLSNGTVVLVSYSTPVAALVPGTGFLRTSTNYSCTTSKHINQWLHGANATSVEQSTIDALMP